MSYVVKNRAKQPIICTMGGGESLRLPIDETITLTKVQYNAHIQHLVEIGDLQLVKTVAETKDGDKVVKAKEQKKSKGGKSDESA